MPPPGPPANLAGGLSPTEGEAAPGAVVTVPAMRRPLALAVPLLLSALVGVACADDPTDAATGRGDDDAGDIDWGDCKDGLGGECATVEVPLDYGDPDGDTIDISVTRAPATGDRKGAVFINPGGPGSTAGDVVEQFANFLPSALNESYDIVGVDPRGTGASELDCGFDVKVLFGADPYVRTEAEGDELVEVNEQYVTACDDEAGDLLSHMGTRDAARDLDQVRDMLGDDQIAYLGLSYGTILGQVYAEEFPDRVRAMVLDGAVAIGPGGVDTAKAQAAGFEQALQAFAADCDAKADCPIAPDSLGKVERLLALVEEAPVDASPRDLGPGEMATGLSLPLYSQDLWPDLATAVHDGLDGDGTAMVKLADTYLGEANFDLYYAVNCRDYAWPDDADALLEAARNAAPTAPHFGQAEVNQYLECALWPAPSHPLEAPDGPIDPQVLVVATTDDPATPYAEGVQTAKDLGGVLLTHQGEGHTVVGQGNVCVDAAVTSYLLDGTLPAEGTTCDDDPGSDPADTATTTTSPAGTTTPTAGG